MRDVYVLASFTTHFKRWPEKSHTELTREAYEGVLADAGLERGTGIDSAWFGNCAMHLFGQANIRGQVVMTPLVAEGRFPEGAPIINVEGGCATGSLAFIGARDAVASGSAELSLAIGVEKTFIPTAPEKMLQLFDGGMDQTDPSRWRTLYGEAEAAAGKAFAPSPGRITLLDVCALQAAWHMKRYGTTAQQLAFGASKNHAHGAMNPKAQYQQTMSVEEVLADKPVIEPFTRAMCAPVSDGAAAVLVCSKDFLLRQSERAQRRASKVLASVVAGGRYRRIDEPSVTTLAAKRAFQQAGVTPREVDFAEVHDATSFAEVQAVEGLGFCAEGDGGRYLASGATTQQGERPINLSGGLVSKGHPLAASGLAMINELQLHLRGEAGTRQAPKAKIGLAQNAGGLLGFDEALCAVTVLQRGAST